MKTPTDLGSTSATLGNGTDAAAADHLTPATSNPMGITSQVEVGTTLETGSRVLEGSHGVGDHRQQAASVDPLRDNDTAPRSPTDDSEGVGA